MNAQHDGERIASLEPKVDYLIKAVDKLADSLENNYPPRAEIDARLNHVDQRHKALEERIEKLENAAWKWMTLAFGAVGAVSGIAAWFHH